MRRRLAVVTVEQLAFAITPVLAGFIVLLLLGTQVLHWYWLSLLGIVGLTIAGSRIRARLVSRYRTAQLLDRHFHLNDSLSTAWFLLEHKRDEPDGIALFQLQQAEAIAAGVQPARAFRFVWRAWAIAGVLAVVAFGLFATRYFVTKSLSFEQALIPIQITPVFERIEKGLLASNRVLGDSATSDRAERNAEQLGTQLPTQKPEDLQQSQGEQAGQSNNSTGKAVSSGQVDPDKNGKSQTGEGLSREGNSPNQQANTQHSDQPTADEKGPQGASGKQGDASSQHGSQGLMDKMRDALSSLMAKMRQNSAQESPQGNQAAEQEKAAAQATGKPQQGQQPSSSNQQPSDQESAEAQAQGKASERTQAGQSRSSDSMPEKGADAHSGVGRQDGDKALKEAEQLQAMGKLEEIIGKRSASLTGDMVVETPSGKQQLKTAYTQKLGHHSDSGGEINRDDIPLADQQYVREYMELIHRQAAKTDR